MIVPLQRVEVISKKEVGVGSCLALCLKHINIEAAVFHFDFMAGFLRTE